MCGIYGYIGQKRHASEAVFDGLKRLEYRGYDSWGIATVKNSKILLTKHEGRIDGRKLKLPKTNIAIGHTRWATHGAVNDLNAHPHFSSDMSFVLAQNGIMENYEKEKKNLFKQNYKFISQTDTEVIVRLIEKESMKHRSFVSAVRSAFLKLKGRNTIIILTNKEQVIALRNGSPLVVGYSNDMKEIYVSSDTLSFAPYVDKTQTLENGEMLVIDDGKLEIRNIKSQKIIKLNGRLNEINNISSSKKNYKHYMIKEINEQPSSIAEVTKQDKDLLSKLANAIKKNKKVYCIGSGTAGAAAAQTAYYLRKIAGIEAIGLIGAESDDYLNLFKKGDILYVPSQSGETADVLEIIEKAVKKEVKIASYVNMPGSLMTKLSDFSFMANTGPEICVMSTKVFVSQIAFGYLLAKTIANKHEDGIKNLKKLSNNMSAVLKNKNFNNEIKNIARKLVNKEHIFLLGKGQNAQIIKEGMVKIIEGSYIHAHAIPAGDLKHYAITLMEPGVPVIPVVSFDENEFDVINAVSEVKARGAEIINLPKMPNMVEVDAILKIVPLQLLAYYLALFKGNDVDKPRNIAKSVTVK